MMPEFSPGIGTRSLAVVVLPELILSTWFVQDFEGIERGNRFAIVVLYTGMDNHTELVIDRCIVPFDLFHRQSIDKISAQRQTLQQSGRLSGCVFISDMISSIAEVSMH